MLRTATNPPAKAARRGSSCDRQRMRHGVMEQRARNIVLETEQHEGGEVEEGADSERGRVAEHRQVGQKRERQRDQPNDGKHRAGAGAQPEWRTRATEDRGKCVPEDHGVL